jgi:hypothetical protein
VLPQSKVDKSYARRETAVKNYSFTVCASTVSTLMTVNNDSGRPVRKVRILPAFLKPHRTQKAGAINWDGGHPPPPKGTVTPGLLIGTLAIPFRFAKLRANPVPPGVMYG